MAKEWKSRAGVARSARDRETWRQGGIRRPQSARSRAHGTPSGGLLGGIPVEFAPAAAFDEAEAAKEAGEERVILIGLSGHGHFDMSAYEAYLSGKLEDLEFSEADMEAALERLPDVPAPA